MRFDLVGPLNIAFFRSWLQKPPATPPAPTGTINQMWRAAVKAYPRTTAAAAVSALVADVGVVLPHAMIALCTSAP
jgi:hypothetical protein